MSKSRLSDEWGAFTGIPNEFIDNAENLSDQARWFFVFLRRYTNGQTGIAFPSYDHIQAKTGWTHKTIAKAVRELEEDGWLIRYKNFGAPTEYKLVKKHFPTGTTDTSLREELTLPYGKNSTSLREESYFPTGRTVLPYGKTIKKEYKTKEERRGEEKASPRATSSPEEPKAIVEGLGETLEDLYPGHATNFKTMRELQDLVHRVSGTINQVKAFDGWLKARYPMKANTPFTFKDLFPVMVKESAATSSTSKPKAKYCGQCNSGWMMNAKGEAFPCKCQK